MVAPPKPATATQDPGQTGFNLNKFGEMWSQNEAARQERMAAEQEALKNKQEADKGIYQLQDNSLTLKKDFVKGIEPIVNEFKTVEAARQRQTELQSSGSIVDQLQAMQDAMLNPKLATTRGRANLRAELNASLSTLATVHAAEQDAIGSEMDLIKLGLGVKNAKYDTTKLLEQQSLEVLQAEQARLDAITGGLQRTQQAREMILSDMSQDELIAAKNASLKAGRTNVAGFDMPGHNIDTEIARREAAQYDMAVKKLALESRNDQLEERAMNRTLMTRSTTEIQKLISGESIKIMTPEGPIIAGPMDFKPHLLKQAYDLKTQIESDQLKENRDNAMFGDLGQEVIVPGLNKWKTLTTKLPPGSASHNLAIRRQMEYTKIGKDLEEARKIMGENPTPEQTKIFNSMAALYGEKLLSQNAADDKLIEQQALKDANGDKELASIYSANYRGEPVNQATVTNLAIGRLTKGQDLSDIFVPDMAKSVQKIYAEKLAAIRATNSFDMGTDLLSKEASAKLIAQEAIQQASVELARPATDKFLGSQAVLNLTKDPAIQGNPIAQMRDSTGEKIFKQPEQLLTMIKQSDLRAEEQMNQDPLISKFTPEQRQVLRNGQPVTNADGETLDPTTFQQMANNYQNQAFLVSLEEMHAGLADQYVKWWNESGPKYADQFVSSEMEATMATGTAQDNATRTMTALTVERSINNYRQGLISSHSMYREEMQKRRQNWVSYDSDPANRQAALLQFNPELSDKEKTQVFRQFLRPLINEGKKNNLPYDQINSIIEDAIANPDVVPGYKENPALKKLIGKIQLNRGEIVRSMEALSDSPWLQGNDKKVSDAVWARMSKENKQEETPVMWKNPFFNQPAQSMTEDIDKSGPVGNLMRQLFERRIKGSNDEWLSNETGGRPYDWYRNLIANPEQTQEGNQ